MLVLGILLSAVGLMMILKPGWIWIITESWKSNDGTEPFDLYIWSTRFGGVMCTIVGLASFIVSFND
jgi:hypothetical protein